MDWRCDNVASFGDATDRATFSVFTCEDWSDSGCYPGAFGSELI